MIKEHDRIVLTAPVPAAGFEVGDVGAVVPRLSQRKAFEVEFTTLDGRPPQLPPSTHLQFGQSPAARSGILVS